MKDLYKLLGSPEPLENPELLQLSIADCTDPTVAATARHVLLNPQRKSIYDSNYRVLTTIALLRNRLGLPQPETWDSLESIGMNPEAPPVQPLPVQPTPARATVQSTPVAEAIQPVAPRPMEPYRPPKPKKSKRKAARRKTTRQREARPQSERSESAALFGPLVIGVSLGLALIIIVGLFFGIADFASRPRPLPAPSDVNSTDNSRLKLQPLPDSGVVSRTDRSRTTRSDGQCG